LLTRRGDRKTKKRPRKLSLTVNGSEKNKKKRNNTCGEQVDQDMTDENKRNESLECQRWKVDHIHGP
uniref:Uncharacterized protein n=1 Tax=Cucumis melo TaxID=3656 RepID=A0A9I9E535_CUCME